jgi:hypothetical protein
VIHGGQDRPAVFLTGDLDERPPVLPGRDQHGPVRSLTAEDDAARRDPQAAGDLVPAGLDQHRPADAAGIGRQA